MSYLYNLCISANNFITSSIFKVYVNLDGQIFLQIAKSTANHDQYYSGVSAATNVTDGHWHHVAAVKTQTSVLFYVDGVQVESNIAQSIKDKNSSTVTKYYNDSLLVDNPKAGQTSANNPGVVAPKKLLQQATTTRKDMYLFLRQ